jgi:nicotinamide mononucleotide transporter
MSTEEIIQQFLADIGHTKWYEYLAVFAGIISVWFSRIENIWVYPIGLINTIIYIYISLHGSLPGEASVNCYYTVMSIIGWYKWNQKDTQHHLVLHITKSSRKEWIEQLLFFTAFYIVIFVSLTFFKKYFLDGAIPWADALASASAFTGMWLMTKKKTESWIWWIITNITSIPLYFVKHYVFTSIYYLILLVLAVMGLIEWWKRSNLKQHGG